MNPINRSGTWGFFDWTDPFGGIVYKYQVLSITGEIAGEFDSVSIVLNGNILIGPQLESIRIDDHVSNGIVIQWEKLFEDSITYIFIDNVLVGSTANDYFVTGLITPDARNIIELYEVHPDVDESQLDAIREVIPGDKALLTWTNPNE